MRRNQHLILRGDTVFGLPKSTELSKQLPKKAIYAKFNMNTAAKEKFDADISKIAIVAEISPSTTTIAKGETVSSIYVLLVSLKRKDFDEKTIAGLSKLIDQNILFVLDFDGKRKLAVNHGKLMQGEWTSPEDLIIPLKGLNFDAVWQNIIVQIGEVRIEQGKTLDEQLAIDEKRAKLQKEIDRLEKLARAERQPKKKLEIVKQKNTLQKQLDENL